MKDRKRDERVSSTFVPHGELIGRCTGRSEGEMSNEGGDEGTDSFEHGADEQHLFRSHTEVRCIVDGAEKERQTYITTTDGFDEVEGGRGSNDGDGTEDGLNDIGRKRRTRALEERITIVVCSR